MVFRHHSTARHSQRSSTTEQDERSGRSQEYERSSEAPQYERSGEAPQYERSREAPQYERSREAPQYERYGTSQQYAETPRSAMPTGRGLPGGWLAELVLGLATLALGLIVAFHPTHSLTVLAVLLGVLMVVSGVYHVVRSLQGTGDHRMWRAIGGVLFFLAGIFLIRHTGLTLAIIATFVGFAFIMAGIAALAEAIGGHHVVMVRVWSAVFGLICLAAGIAAIVTPIHSLTRLAIVLGWAFAAMGILHMIGAFVSRRALRMQPQPGQVSVPGQRATEATGVEGAYGGSPATRAGAPGHRPPRP